MSDVVVEPPGSGEPEGVKTPRKAAIAGWIGSALEYYDFFIYGTAAALVFPSSLLPAPATRPPARSPSLATFGVGYVARPIGAFFMGHIGDKFGRKRVLIFTLLLMGVSTFWSAACPPTTRSACWRRRCWSLLRLLQGLSASGEQAGRQLDDAGARAGATDAGFYTSFTLSAAPRPG